MTAKGTGFQDLLAKVADGHPLTADESESAFDVMMSGEAEPAQMGAFLMALRVRGETVDEITGAARSMRAKAQTVEAPDHAIDTCGTGGDVSGTFNVSTAAAIVAAGAGVPVAKHGNRAMSSRSGSADMLAALGVNIDADPIVVEEALRDAGLGFLMAPNHHGAMRHVGPTRKALGTRTIFNLLGPLANPAGTRRQLVGVFAPKWLEPVARVLGNLGAERAWVVHGHDGLDELTVTGPSTVAELKPDHTVTVFEVTPEDAGLSRHTPEAMAGGTPEQNAQTMTALLDGKGGAVRDFVLLNAAAALVVAGKADTLSDGVARARSALDSGRAQAALERLVHITQSGS